MVTSSELQQAIGIASKIRLGKSIRTDPRSPVGSLVNKILQRDITAQENLQASLSKGLLTGEARSRAEALLNVKIDTPKPTPPPVKVERIEPPKPTRPPSVVGLPSREGVTLTAKEKKKIERSIAIGKLKDKLITRIDELIVPSERGLGIFTRGKTSSSPIVIERKITAFGQGTPTFTAREKNFFEKLNINPNSSNSQNLQKQVLRTQSLFLGGVLTEKQARARNDSSIKSFQSKEILRGLPSAVALGGAFALISAVPVVGQIAGVLLGADLLIKRKEIAKQFAEFPLETTATLGAFALGGVAGSRVLGKVTSLKALEDSNLTFIVEKVEGVTKTPLSKTFPKEIKFKINEGAVRTFAQRTLKKNGVDFNKLSAIEQNFVLGQIKAFVRNNPAKLIPKARQQALKNIKRSRLRKLIKDRIEGKFSQSINFKSIKSRKDLQRLNPQQRVALLSFSKNVRQRAIIKKRVKERVKFIREEKIKIDKTKSVNEIIEQSVKTISRKDLITKTKGEVGGFVKGKEIFLVKEAPKSLKRDIVAHEKGHLLFDKLKLHSKIKKLSPAKQKTLLKNAKKFLKQQGVLKFITNKKVKGLSKTQLIIEEFLVRKATPRIKRVTTERRLDKKIKKAPVTFKIKKPSVVRFDVKKVEGVKRIKKKTKPLTFKIQKPKVVRFDTIKSGRQVLLQKTKQVQKQSQKLKQFEVISGEIASLQKLALKRAGKTGKSKVKLKQAKKTSEQVIKKVEQKQKVVQKQIQKQKQKQVQKQKITERQIQKVKRKIEQIQKTKQKFKQLPKQRIRLAQLTKQKTKLNQKLRQQQKLVQKESQNEKQLSKQVSQFKQSFSQVSQATAQLQRTRLKPPVRPPLKPKVPKPPKRPVLKKVKKKVVRKVRGGLGFNVFAKSRGKFIKLNPKPLSKQSAKRLGGRVVDNTLSRRFKLKSTGKVKKLGKTKGKFAKQKFRSFKVVKGKRVPLKNTFIEKTKSAIDTRGEKKRLSVKRFLAQQRKPQVKRKATSIQLKSLKKARQVRMQNLKKKK